MSLPANQQSATSPANQRSLPDPWIEKLFQKFEDWYGAKWANQYGAFPRERVKRSWAEELGGFDHVGEVIAKALNAQKGNQFPPTLPEFMAICREAAKRIGDGVAPKLPVILTPEDHQRAAAAAEAAIRGMKTKISDGIDKHWATHPRSIQHLSFIFLAANRDVRFKPCVDEMVERGICTAEGVLLKVYRDKSFVKA